MNDLDRYFIERWGINDYVEHRLHHWAKWYGKKDSNHLGFPNESLESRHSSSGGIIDSNHGPKPSPCNPAADELEAIISVLMQSDEKIAKALCNEYLDKRDQVLKARLLGFSVSQFRLDTAFARYWLRGWFHACISQKIAVPYDPKIK